jgi:hypothetical protein
MNIKRFANLVFMLSLLLPLQFLLGIWINLFVKIPDPFVFSFLASGGGAVLVLHVLNALTIVTLLIVAAATAHSLKPVTFRLTFISVLFIFLAIASGITFVFFGQKDAFSFTMALGFIFSVVLISFAGRSLMPPK